MYDSSDDDDTTATGMDEGWIETIRATLSPVNQPNHNHAPPLNVGNSSRLSSIMQSVSLQPRQQAPVAPPSVAAYAANGSSSHLVHQSVQPPLAQPVKLPDINGPRVAVNGRELVIRFFLTLCVFWLFCISV
jgi:hypothetical protein